MGAATGIHVKRVDFSDPQGGKGPCDRKAATIKAHVRRYINEGHDVLTGRDFKDAVLSYGGVKGVRVALVTDASQQPQQELSGRWSGISFLNNFLYQKDCVTVWKAFDIGQGNTIPWSQLQGKVTVCKVNRNISNIVTKSYCICWVILGHLLPFWVYEGLITTFLSLEILDAV